MARAKRQSAAPSSAFAEALRFCSLVLKDQGSINETHCRIADHWVTAFNGTLSIGHKVDSDIAACPQSRFIIEALSKCGQNIAITQLDKRLSIKSDKFRALVPCIDNGLLEAKLPDKPVAEIDERLKQAFEICGLLQTDGDDIYCKSILLNGQSMISSLAGHMILEYWHGIDLPSGLAIPKALIGPLSKINKKVVKFGFSQWSATFYFEDGSWIKSQLYAEQWPNVRQVFDCTSNVQQFPADFWSALVAVSPFGEGMIYLRNGRLSSHATDDAGASYELPGMQGAWAYPARQLAALKPWATHVDFQAQGANGPMLYAVGKSARAVMAGVRQEPIREYKIHNDMDDTIPF